MPFGFHGNLFEKNESRFIQPLQIVYKQHERMLGSCDYPEEAAQYRLETALGVLRRYFGNAGLRTYNEFQFRDEVCNQLGVFADCLLNCRPPSGNLILRLTQDLPDD